jgi:lysophospholipid acyltransferase (LPLAT)-like uncharacterized protein
MTRSPDEPISLDHPIAPSPDDSMTQSPNEPIAEAASASFRKTGEAVPKDLTRLQRLEIRALGWLAAQVVRLIGISLCWEVHGWENWKTADALGKRIVYSFWHHEICAATWFWRKRGIVVMSGYNFDARFTANVIGRLGYEIARGSASRGAARALVAMVRAVQRGHDAAFTIDGPRGPRHVAKPGAVMLAKTTGAAVLCFHIRPARAWVFSKSWDRTEIPRPFTRIAIFIAPPVTVPQDADDAAQAQKLQEVQAALDGLFRQGDDWQAKIR